MFILPVSYKIIHNKSIYAQHMYFIRIIFINYVDQERYELISDRYANNIFNIFVSYHVIRLHGLNEALKDKINVVIIQVVQYG